MRKRQLDARDLLDGQPKQPVSFCFAEKLRLRNKECGAIEDASLQMCIYRFTYMCLYTCTDTTHIFVCVSLTHRDTQIKCQLSFSIELNKYYSEKFFTGQVDVFDMSLLYTENSGRKRRLHVTVT